MTPTLYHCEHSDNGCHHPDSACPYRRPHEHLKDGPVSLWCACGNGKSVKMRCVEIGKGEK